MLCGVAPSVCLEVPLDTSAVSLESDVVVNITRVADVIYGGRYFGCGNVFGGLCRLRT